jgi:hypothetical protein
MIEENANVNVQPVQPVLPAQPSQPVKPVPKKNNNMVIIIVAIVTLIIGGVGGFLLKPNSKCNVKSDGKEDNQEVDKNISYKDIYSLNSYGGKVRLYLINNGTVYYRLLNDNIAALSVCPETDEYCKQNPAYVNDMASIKEISKAKVIRLVRDLNASDESFVNFVITEDNKVYTIRESIDMMGTFMGVKVEEVTSLSGKKIKDLVGINNNRYEFVTVDGNKELL